MQLNKDLKYYIILSVIILMMLAIKWFFEQGEALGKAMAG